MGVALVPRKKRVRDADVSAQYPTWLLSDLTLGEQGIANKRGRTEGHGGHLHSTSLWR